jgi:integrase
MKLTNRRIGELKCRDGRRDRLVFDDEQRGLAVRVTASGSKSYLAQYSIDGAKRRIPLGSFDAISLADARLAAQGIMGEVAHGRDPALLRKARARAAKDAISFGALIDQWSALHLKDRRESYRRAAVQMLRRTFARCLDRPVAGLDRPAILQALDAIRIAKPIAAARSVSYGRACCQWAVDRGTLAANPFAGLKKAPTVKRERVLGDDEVAKIWAVTAAPHPFNAVVRMLLVTGQRRAEVAGLRWDELDSGLVTWTLPAERAKNGVVHVIPLPELAQRVIREHGDRASRHVFPSVSGPFNGFGKGKAALDRRSGVTGWTLHDLRRTVATNLQRLGVRLEVTEAVLNHVGSRGGIAGVYQRHDFADEKRAALAAWGARLEAITGGEVVQLRRR